MSDIKTVKIEVEYDIPADAPTDELLALALRSIRLNEFFDAWAIRFVRASLVEQR